jgi:hypothetical protein
VIRQVTLPAIEMSAQMWVTGIAGFSPEERQRKN